MLELSILVPVLECHKSIKQVLALPYTHLLDVNDGDVNKHVHGQYATDYINSIVLDNGEMTQNELDLELPTFLGRVDEMLKSNSIGGFKKVSLNKVIKESSERAELPFEEAKYMVSSVLSNIKPKTEEETNMLLKLLMDIRTTTKEFHTELIELLVTVSCINLFTSVLAKQFPTLHETMGASDFGLMVEKNLPIIS